MSIDVNVQNDLVIVTESSEDITVNVSNAAGPAGVGVPVGGTTGQVLKKFTNTNYDTYWAADASGLTSVGLSMPSAFAVSNSPLTSNGTIAVTGAGTTSQYLRGDGSLATFPTIPSGTVTSVGLTMPSAFSVANSPVTSSGTLAVTGAGTASQYVRGDGQLANFPDNGGGGSSVNYYLNGSVNQGTFGGDTYYEMSKTPILGAGTNFTRTNGQGNGYIASFITDAGDPSLLNIPGGNWNLEFYFASSASGGSPQFYGEIYKVSSSNVFTLVASGSTNPEGITNGTTVDQYFTSIPIPQTSLLVTDRLAVRIYVIPAGRTITLHTEDGNLCEVLTTLSTGLNALNGLTSQVQYFATGTSGTDFAISSATDTHTFNIPTASATNRGALSSADWSTFSGKVGGSGATGQVAYWNGTNSQTGSAGLTYVDSTGSLGLTKNQNAATALTIANGTNGTGATSQITFSTDLGVSASISKVSASYTPYKILGAGGLNFFSTGSGDINFLNDFNNGRIRFATGQSSTAQMTLTSAGRLLLGTTTEGTNLLDVNGTARVSGAFNVLGDTTLLSTNTTILVSTDYRFNNPSNTVNTIFNAYTFRLNGIRAANIGFILDGANWFSGTGMSFVVVQGPDSTVNAPYEAMRLTSNGNLLLGTITNQASSKLTINSTTQGFLPPRMTTTQKNAISSPAAGLQVYDTTLNQMSYYNGTTWINF